MAETSPFLSNSYEMNRDFLSEAVNQTSLFLSKLTGDDQTVIQTNIRNYMLNHQEEFKSRRATVLIKDKNEDRQVKIIPLSKLLKYIERKNYHLSPSLVAYTNSDEEECVNSIGTRQFIDKRAHYKGLRQINKSNPELYTKYNELQNAFKIFNNAQSGAMSSRGTPITNKSGHTTLTSTCRCLTSTANLINEQFIAGNRFYNTPQNTLQSLMARLISTDLKALSDVIDKYGLYHPTSDDVYQVVVDCSRRYWRNEKDLNTIKRFLDKLTYLELAAILYNLDLVSLFKYNEEFVTKFFDDWTSLGKLDTPVKPENNDQKVLCISKLEGEITPDDIAGLNAYHIQIEEKYSDLISVLFKSLIPPSGLFDVTSSIRDCVLTSDTDSSIYTVDKMIDSYTDDRDKGVRLNAVLTYFIRMISVDQHQQLSANLNVAHKNLKLLHMKNEYYFGGYVTTLMSKHYFASQRMEEGVRNKKMKMEIKGVHLRSSKISSLIRNKATEQMKDIILTIENKEQLDPAVELHSIAELERQVISDLKAGKWHWLSRNNIKDDKYYTNPDASVYLYHELWEEVFAPKYGHAPEMPYSGIKVNVNLGSKRLLNEYLDSIEDKELSERFRTFLEKKEKKDLGNLYVPMERATFLDDIPIEIKQCMDIRTIIKQNFKSIYEILNSTGIYFINEKITRLVSDEH